MGLDDITEKASDAGIEKAGDTAAKKSGGGNAEQIDDLEKKADDKIGK
ncbi:hypothetical protein [Cellulomonas sp. GbtcB1]|nr:hypothetical protein [Cellulomonas sp. GbtcB1]